MPLILYNPTSKDFCTTYDTNGDGHPIQYCVKSRESATFDDPISFHMQKHLADYVLISQGVKTNWEADHKKAVDEVTLKI